MNVEVGILERGCFVVKISNEDSQRSSARCLAARLPMILRALVTKEASTRFPVSALRIKSEVETFQLSHEINR